jgi:hypothetical protein
MRLPPIIAIFLGALLGATSLGAEEIPPRITLYAQQPVVQHLEGFEYGLSFNWGVKIPPPTVKSAELEIRFPGPGRERVRLPYLYSLGGEIREDKRSHRLFWSSRLGENDARRIGPTPPGEYQFAFILNGERVSNVASFRIDPNPPPLPVLQVQPLEPYPGEKWGKVLLRYRGPEPADPRFRDTELHFLPILVDGYAIQRGGFYSGPDPEMKPWEVWAQTFKLTDAQAKELLRLKKISDVAVLDPSQPHTYQLRFADHESEAVLIDPNAAPLEEAWTRDAALYTDRPPPPVTLRGQVKLTGKSGPFYKLSFTGADGRTHVEYTDREGRYEAPGLPEGFYRLQFENVYTSSWPVVVYREVKVAGESTTFSPKLDFEAGHRVSGTVRTADGLIPRWASVEGRWLDAAAGIEYVNRASTDAGGRYELKGPFADLAELRVTSKDTHAEPRAALKAGAEKVDFTLVPN